MPHNCLQKTFIHNGRLSTHARGRNRSRPLFGTPGITILPRTAVGPKFKRGAKFVLSPNFKQARPIFCSKKPKTSASQTETWFPPTRLIPHSYSVGAKTTSPPAAKPRRPPSAIPSHPSTAALLHHAGADTPTSSSTATSTATPSMASS